ncbi:hypothetical protein WI604_15905 [Bradyrhizobium symbiodeficiens]|uniref:hypothetical protein n=1 Tax=Bradyrhizobium symbiodeficiens TaxID=1404367 RepID=UPI0030D60B03
MAEAFTWGAGGEQETTASRSRRKLAEALMMEGGSTAPVQHWTQGLARVAQALVGGYELSKEDQRDQQQQADAQAILASHPAFAGASPGVAKVASALAGPTAVAPAGDAASAIAGIESGGKYDLLGPVTKTGDRAYGKYQVMGANIPEWTKVHLGQPMTPDQFLASPEAQDAVFKGQFGQYSQKYGPEGAAKAWFAGEGGMNNPNARDQLGTTVQAYGDRFRQAYQPTAAGQADPNALPVNAQLVQGYAIPGQAAAPAGPQMPPAVSSWVQRAIRNPATRGAAMQVLSGYAKPRESYTQETDADGNIWSVNQQTGQRALQLKHDKPTEAPTSVREYEYYKAGLPQGAQPMPYDTWSTAKARAAATNVTTNLGGGSDEQIFKEMVDRSKSARAVAQGLTGIRNAREAIDGGAITGFKADDRLSLQKAAKYFGVPFGDADKIENSETFKAAIAPQVAAIVKATVGTTNISDADRRFAERAAGGSLDLDEGSIKRLLDIMERASTSHLQQYQETLDALYPEPDKHKRERALFGVRVTPGGKPAGTTDTGIQWRVK